MSVSATAPNTCGMQRTAYGSCTRSQFSWLRADLTVGEQPPEAVRNIVLARQAAGGMNAGIEGRVAPGQRIDGQSAHDDRAVQQVLRAQQSFDGKRGAELCAVEERESFLGFELERSNARGMRYFLGRQCATALARLTFADQREGEMRERARSPEAPTEPRPGMTGSTSRLRRAMQRLDHQWANAGKPRRETIGLEEQDTADDRIRQGLADAATVAADQVELQLLDLACGNLPIGECAETGGDAIAHTAVSDRCRNACRGWPARADAHPRPARVSGATARSWQASRW